MKRHCVDQPLLCIPEKQLRSEQLFITGLKEKKQVDEFLLFVKLYFSSTFSTHNSVTITLIKNFQPACIHLLTSDFRKGSAMRFFKNASKK